MLYRRPPYCTCTREGLKKFELSGEDESMGTHLSYPFIVHEGAHADVDEEVARG